MSYDSSCRILAESFLNEEQRVEQRIDGPSEQRIDALAQHIQDAVEDFFHGELVIESPTK